MGTKHMCEGSATLVRVPSWQGAEKRLLAEHESRRRKGVASAPLIFDDVSGPHPCSVLQKSKKGNTTPQKRNTKPADGKELATPPKKKPGLPDCAKVKSNNDARKAAEAERKEAAARALAEKQAAAEKYQAAVKAEQAMHELAAVKKLAAEKAASERRQLRAERERIQAAAKVERAQALAETLRADESLNKFFPPSCRPEGGAYKVVHVEYGPFLN